MPILNQAFDFWFAEKYFEPSWKSGLVKTEPAGLVSLPLHMCVCTRVCVHMDACVSVCVCVCVHACACVCVPEVWKTYHLHTSKIIRIFDFTSQLLLTSHLSYSKSQVHQISFWVMEGIHTS